MHHKKTGRPIVDRTGIVFNGIKVIKFSAVINRNAVWDCLCHCGKAFQLNASRIGCGISKSCGCLQGPVTHGQTCNGKFSLEYNSWRAMITRCTNPNNNRYYCYGGRGIKVCKRWVKFSNFFDDMGKKPSPQHSINRKNNDGNYTPRNCCWETRSNQMKNRAPFNRGR